LDPFLLYLLRSNMTFVGGHIHIQRMFLNHSLLRQQLEKTLFFFFYSINTRLYLRHALIGNLSYLSTFRSTYVKD
jgi:hypothetical protein